MEQSPPWEAESLLAIHRNYQHFVEPVGLLQYSQQPAIIPYLVPDECSPRPILYLEDQF
jgi:hypothetical protein